jgi:glycosyltransferase involved in cell wall biosynthesis
LSSVLSSKIPTVSVILSVRNGEPYLKQAVDSILAQSFGDFELIVVDNHSTDDSPRIVESYDDDRIVLTRPEDPLHLAQALNYAASMARGEFVARMDADDVSHPSRFEKQVAYLKEHPEVGILGAQICPIDEDGAPITRGHYYKPESHADIACSLFFGCALWHPTVMLRKSVIDELGWYSSPVIAGREEYSTEDYDLWCRAIAHTQIHNLAEELLDYRIHAENHSLASSRRSEHYKNLILILQNHLKNSLKVDATLGLCASLLGLDRSDAGEEGNKDNPVSHISGLISPILNVAKETRVSAAGMKQLREQLATSAETEIWYSGMNIMRECLVLCRADWQIGAKVSWRSMRRFL